MRSEKEKSSQKTDELGEAFTGTFFLLHVNTTAHNELHTEKEQPLQKEIITVTVTCSTSSVICLQKFFFKVK